MEFAIKIAKEAGELTIKEAEKGFKISKKGPRDLVTNADKASEKLIKSAIKKAFPDHGILAEESENDLKEIAKKDFIWIIDPIDGTTNYAHGIPNYSISIAVFATTYSESSKNFEYKGGELIAGVVHAPRLNETFYAAKDQGAFLNGKKIQVSTTKTLQDSVVATGFPYENKEEALPYFEKIVSRAQGIRRFGSAALDLCYLAAGRFDAFWELGLQPWDIAAGALIVQEAGGHLTDLNGAELDLFSKEILASNKHTHQEMIDTLNI